MLKSSKRQAFQYGNFDKKSIFLIIFIFNNMYLLLEIYLFFITLFFIFALNKLSYLYVKYAKYYLTLFIFISTLSHILQFIVKIFVNNLTLHPNLSTPLLVFHISEFHSIF